MVGPEPIECPELGDCEEQMNMPMRPSHRNFLGRQITDMVRTTAVGSRTTDLPTGNPLNNLQINNLEPGEHTIQFEAFPPATGGFAAYAIVTWKLGGQQIVRKVSVFSGAAISGIAEAVDVKLVDYSDIAGAPAKAALPYKIAAAMTRGMRADTMQPATLISNPRVIALPSTTATQIVIPQNAGVISCMVLASNPASLTVLTNTMNIVAGVIDAGGNVLQSWYPINQSPGWVPLPGSAVSLSIFNSDVSAAQVNVIWGIEG